MDQREREVLGTTRRRDTRGASRAAGTRRVVRAAAAILALALVAGMSSGCAQVMAVRQPAPINRDLLAVGADRTVVIGVLGAPVSAEDGADGGRSEIYKYVDGGAKNAWWSKTGRVLFYTAGDVFTAWLAQVIWMPLELAFRGTEYASTVGYDRNGGRMTVRNFEEIEAKSGKYVRSGGAPAPVASR